MRHRRTAHLAPPTDAELIARAREGDAQAFAVLHDRHAPAANAAARALCRSRTDADDVVAEAFTRVLKALRNGNGPTEAFKPYLLQCVRNAVIDRSRRDGRIDLTEDPPEAANDTDAFGDSVERALVADAFTRIPERWQAVLWHTEVEGRPAAELAPLLGLSPNAVAALAYRAREGLRQAYLQAHVQGTAEGACSPVVMQLGAYARNAVSPRDKARIERHLAGCTSCQAVHAELAELEVSLRRVLVPAVLGIGVTAELFLSHLSSLSVSGITQTIGGTVTRLATHASQRLGGRGSGVVRWMQSSPSGSTGVGAAAAAVAIAAASVGGAAVVPNILPTPGTSPAAAAPPMTGSSTSAATGSSSTAGTTTPSGELVAAGVEDPTTTADPSTTTAESSTTAAPDDRLGVTPVGTGSTVLLPGTTAAPTPPEDVKVLDGGIQQEAPPVRDEPVPTVVPPTVPATAPATSPATAPAAAPATTSTVVSTTLPAVPGPLDGADDGPGSTVTIPSTTTAPAGPKNTKAWAKWTARPGNGVGKVTVNVTGKNIDPGDGSVTLRVELAGGGEIVSWGSTANDYQCELETSSVLVCHPSADATGSIWFRLVYPAATRLDVTAIATVPGDSDPDDDSFTISADAP